jgi:hypothetical protein
MSKVGLAAKIRHSGKSSKPEKSAGRDLSLRVRIRAEVKSMVVEKCQLGTIHCVDMATCVLMARCLHTHVTVLPLHSHYTQMSDVISVLKILQDSTQFSSMGVTLSCMLHLAKVDNPIIFGNERIHYK